MSTLFQVHPISYDIAANFIKEHHYSRVMPKLTRCVLGSSIDGNLIAVMTLGLGVKPVHTIRKLFPSLGSEDYFEIGKLCLTDEMPRNSESQFISGCIGYIRRNFPSVKVLYTWADGMLGKAGYVYQASNFLYGGYIWTDSYFTDNGGKIHPRSSRFLCDLNAQKNGRERMFWLDESFMREHGIARFKGKQFRYCYFLCAKKDEKRLTAESTVTWNREYPKAADLEWKVLSNGKYIPSAKPLFSSALSGKDVRSMFSTNTIQLGLL